MSMGSRSGPESLCLKRGAGSGAPSLAFGVAEVTAGVRITAEPKRKSIVPVRTP